MNVLSMVVVILLGCSQETPAAGRIRQLIGDLNGDVDFCQGNMVAHELAGFGEEATPFLTEGIQSQHARVRQWCAQALANMGPQYACTAEVALIQALKSEKDLGALLHLIHAVGIIKPQPERAIAILCNKTLEHPDPKVKCAAAKALAEFGSAATVIKPFLTRLLDCSNIEVQWEVRVQWEVLATLKKLGVDKADLEVMKDLRLREGKGRGREILVELFALPEAAITFVQRNPWILQQFERNDVALIELFSHADDGRETLRHFLKAQKGLPRFFRIDRTKGESWGFVMGWPRNEDVGGCFPQRELAVKIVGNRAQVEDLDENSEYKLWVKDGIAILCIEGKWGFIDEKGVIVIRPAFDYVGHLFCGAALVVQGQESWYIDRQGRYVAAPHRH